MVQSAKSGVRAFRTTKKLILLYILDFEKFNSIYALENSEETTELIVQVMKLT